MKSASVALITGILSLTVVASASAEVLLLKDGSKIEGTVTRNGDGYEVLDTAGKVTQIAADQVQSIQIGSRALTAPEAQSRLISLRRSVENRSDLDGIIDDYHHFIDQMKDSPIATEAKHDLEAWQQRKDQKLVKLGTRWISQAERDQTRKQATDQMVLARSLMGAAKMNDAKDVIDQALALDPGNPTASYLEGILQFNRVDMPSARKNFEAVLVSDKNHAATLNNMGVVLWKQNQQIAALISYTQAMLSEPNVQTTLDNVAEALHTLPSSAQQNAATKRIVQIFQQQDGDLQKQMAAMGLHRWGATWVDEASFAQLQAQQKQIDDAVAKISSQVDQLKQDQNGCDTQINSIQQDIQNIQNSSVATDSKGHQIVINTTWQTQPLYQQITKLQKQKSDDQAKIDGCMHDIQQERAKIKTPSYTATQKLIGIERTPGLTPMKIAPTFSSPPIVAPIPAPPATQPTGPALPAGIGNPVTPGPTTR